MVPVYYIIVLYITEVAKLLDIRSHFSKLNAYFLKTFLNTYRTIIIFLKFKFNRTKMKRELGFIYQEPKIILQRAACFWFVWPPLIYNIMIHNN